MENKKERVIKEASLLIRILKAKTKRIQKENKQLEKTKKGGV